MLLKRLSGCIVMAIFAIACESVPQGGTGQTPVPDPTTENGSGNTSSGSSGGGTTGSSGGGHTLVGDKTGYQHIPYTFTPTLPLSGVVVYSISNKPAWASFNTSTGQLSGTPTDNGIHNNINISVTNGSETISTGNFSLAINGDPLRKQQWHLKNTQQKTYAQNAGALNEDIKATEAWGLGYDGTGVKLAVSDSGVEITHQDLSENMLSGQHRNYTKVPSQWASNPTPSEAHGSAVAGLIAARGWNNIGVTGVAPKAKVAGFQFIDSSQNVDILNDQASGNFDIWNYSYGDDFNEDQQSDPTYAAHLRTQTVGGGARSGKGGLFVKSAGNEYYFCASNYLGQSYVCSPHNANIPYENELPYIILAGATNALGVKASYSNAGSNIWVSAPGGEFGFTDPAMLTVDLSTCSSGYSASSSLTNSFEYGHADNTQCNYTSTMNGTSSAAPVVSGVIALLLQARPDLTWRDVKHILASTADKVDTTTGATTHPTPVLNLAGHTYEQGWVTNGAGYKFHNWYGFGRVNAKAALQAAASHALLPALIELNYGFSNAAYASGNVNLAIPDHSSTGVTSSIVIAGTNRTVETVMIRLNASHTMSGQLGFELTSPAGTKSILLNINNSLMIPYSTGDSVDQHLSNLVLTSHAFYGESTNGSWTLKAIDGYPSNTGTLTNWSMSFLAH